MAELKRTDPIHARRNRPLAALPRGRWPPEPPMRPISRTSTPSSARRWRPWTGRCWCWPGAGTGKTRVLTTRIAHILNLGRARPGEILAVTFTNKAAREMKDRVGLMVGQIVEGMPWMGTFHSIGVKILRRHAELVGLKSNFTILDVDDQIRLIKQLFELEKLDEKRWPARVFAGILDGWKNRGLTPDQVPGGEAATFANGKGKKLYAAYQERLKTLNACDFGDLLLETIRLFRAHPDVLRQYQRASSSSWWTSIRTPTWRSICGCGCWRRRRARAPRPGTLTLSPWGRGCAERSEPRRAGDGGAVMRDPSHASRLTPAAHPLPQRGEGKESAARPCGTTHAKKHLLRRR